MKKLVTLALVLSLMVVGTTPTWGQTAVKKAIKSAEIVSKDATKSHVNDLKSDYKKALSEINKLQSAAAKKETAQEQVAVQGGDWVALQNTMEKLAQMGVLSFKVNDLDFETPWIAAKQKTCDLYFAKGKQELEKSKNLDKQLTAFGLLDKASTFASKNDSAINQLKKEILLPRALELAKSWKTSDKATALTILNDIALHNAENPEIVAQIATEHEKLQEEFYKDAEKLFKDRNYKDQYKAIAAYELVGNYKDAKLKAELARKRGALTIAVMEEHGDTSITLNPKTIKKLEKEFPEYVTFSGYEGLTKKQLVDKKCALILVYDAKTFGKYTCKHEDGKKDKDIIQYVERTAKNGKLIEKSISAREYEKGKESIVNAANFVAYKGVVETNWTTSTITLNYAFKIIDLREDSTRVVATIEKPGTVSLSVTGKYIETYSGDEQSKPKKLKNINDNINDKALLGKAKKEKLVDWDFNLLLMNKTDEIKKELEELLPYRHYAQ